MLLGTLHRSVDCRTPKSCVTLTALNYGDYGIFLLWVMQECRIYIINRSVLAGLGRDTLSVRLGIPFALSSPNPKVFLAPRHIARPYALKLNT